MTQKNTPPSSPDIGKEEIINGEDIEEIIDVNEDFDEDLEDERMEDDSFVEEESFMQDDTKYIFTKHTGAVFCGTLSNDGELAATGGEDDKAYVWNTSSGKVVLECTGHKDSVVFAGFNQENTYLATGDMGGTVQVWTLHSKVPIWDYSMGDITWMQWHTVANILFAGSVEGEVYMWKVPDGECKILQGLGQRVEVAALLPDGKRIVIGYDNGIVRIMDLKTCNALHTITSEVGHSGPITTIDCHINNSLIISASVDGKTVLSTSQNGKVVSVLQNFNENETSISNQENEDDKNDNQNWVETASFLKNSEQLIAATGTVNGEIFIWDIAKQTIRHKLIQDYGISKLLWKDDTMFIYSASFNGVLLCHDGRTGDCVQYFMGHMANILDLFISKNGKEILTVSDDHTARIFKIENNQ